MMLPVPTHPTLLPVRVPCADMQLQLISDIGPELVYRWCEGSTTVVPGRPNNHVIPAVFRALLSAVLRAPSFSDADDFMRAHRVVSNAHADVPACLLGFATDTSPRIRTSVLYDLLHSATLNQPLLPGAAALSFYDSAGAGSGDTAEYHEASVDHRTDCCEQGNYLPNVRLYALSLVLNVYAQTIADGKSGKLIPDAIAEFNLNTLLKPYVTTMPYIVDNLDSNIACAMHNFYAAYYAQCAPAQREDYRNHLLHVVLAVASSKPEHLLRFLSAVSPPALRLTVARRALLQRFDINDSSLTAGLSLSRALRKYLPVQPLDGRPNAAVPALLAVLFSTLEALDDDSPFVAMAADPEKATKRVKTVNRMLKRDWSLFKAPAEDVTSLRLVLFHIGQMIFHHAPPK